MINPHVEFILAAYAITFGVIVAIIAALMLDYRAQKQALAKFEPRGDEKP